MGGTKHLGENKQYKTKINTNHIFFCPFRAQNVNDILLVKLQILLGTLVASRSCRAYLPGGGVGTSRTRNFPHLSQQQRDSNGECTYGHQTTAIFEVELLKLNHINFAVRPQTKPQQVLKPNQTIFWSQTTAIIDVKPQKFWSQTAAIITAEPQQFLKSNHNKCYIWRGEESRRIWGKLHF